MSLVSGSIPNLINGVSQQPDVVRLSSQCEEMVNCYPTLLDFLRRRPATRHLAKLLSTKAEGARIHTISRDGNEKYIVLILGGEIRVFTLTGQEVNVTYENRAAYLDTLTPSSSLRCLTVNDYTFILNTTQTVKTSTELTPALPRQALVFIKQASYATTYTIKLTDDISVTHTTPRDDNAGKYVLSSTAITADLTQQINALGGYEAVCVKSSIHITPATTEQPFLVSVDDSRSNTHLSLATSRVQRFSDLPTVAPNGYVCEITGDASSSFDNYYTIFATNEDEAFGQGVWEETNKPASAFRLDAGTMPHALVREADGTFVFKPLEWEDRLCGDDDSVPLPLSGESSLPSSCTATASGSSPTKTPS